MSNWKIAHLTTVHPRGDTRILYRQASALADSNGWDFVLIVADGQGSATLDVGGTTIAVNDIGPIPGGRIRRAIIGPWRAFAEVRRLGINVVHFHDPELIPLGLLLRLFGRKVIYDVHEDTPRQVLNKFWIPRVLRIPASWGVGMLEWIAGRVFDAVVAATPLIADRYPAGKTILVQNFPIVGELESINCVPYVQRSNDFVYIGRVAKIRGASEMVRAIGLVDESYGSRLDLAGDYSPPTLVTALQELPGWEQVRSHGWADRQRVAKLLAGAKAGLVILHPTHSYPDAYPVKMFEYMGAGLPVIASDFPLWRRIVDDAGCGLLVDPLDCQAIADAMSWLLDHCDEAEAMGRRGREAVHGKYNWQSEASKLLQKYRELLDMI